MTSIAALPCGFAGKREWPGAGSNRAFPIIRVRVRDCLGRPDPGRSAAVQVMTVCVPGASTGRLPRKTSKSSRARSVAYQTMNWARRRTAWDGKA